MAFEPPSPCGRHRMLVLLACLLFCSSPQAAGEASRFTPANLSEDVRATLEGLDLPLSDGKGPLTIRCATWVLSNGDPNGVVCYPDAERGSLVLRHSVRITRALSGKEFSPARVDGEAVWTWFDFSLVIFEADGETRVRALPNHGANVERLGTSDYTAPQRYTFQGWTCRSRSFSRATSLVAVVRVSEDGDPLEVRFAHPMPNGSCFDRVENALMSSRYIPAHVGDTPVEALYLEFVNLSNGKVPR